MKRNHKAAKPGPAVRGRYPAEPSVVFVPVPVPMLDQAHEAHPILNVPVDFVNMTDGEHSNYIARVILTPHTNVPLLNENGRQNGKRQEELFVPFFIRLQDGVSPLKLGSTDGIQEKFFEVIKEYHSLAIGGIDYLRTRQDRFRACSFYKEDIDSARNLEKDFYESIKRDEKKNPTNVRSIFTEYSSLKNELTLTVYNEHNIGNRVIIPLPEGLIPNDNNKSIELKYLYSGTTLKQATVEAEDVAAKAAVARATEKEGAGEIAAKEEERRLEAQARKAAEATRDAEEKMAKEEMAKAAAETKRLEESRIAEMKRLEGLEAAKLAKKAAENAEAARIAKEDAARKEAERLRDLKQKELKTKKLEAEKAERERAAAKAAKESARQKAKEDEEALNKAATEAAAARKAQLLEGKKANGAAKAALPLTSSQPNTVGKGKKKAIKQAREDREKGSASELPGNAAAAITEASKVQVFDVNEENLVSKICQAIEVGHRGGEVTVVDEGCEAASEPITVPDHENGKIDAGYKEKVFQFGCFLIIAAAQVIAATQIIATTQLKSSAAKEAAEMEKNIMLKQIALNVYELTAFSELNEEDKALITSMFKLSAQESCDADVIAAKLNDIISQLKGRYKLDFNSYGRDDVYKARTSFVKSIYWGDSPVFLIACQELKTDHEELKDKIIKTLRNKFGSSTYNKMTKGKMLPCNTEQELRTNAQHELLMDTFVILRRKALDEILAEHRTARAAEGLTRPEGAKGSSANGANGSSSLKEAGYKQGPTVLVVPKDAASQAFMRILPSKEELDRARFICYLEMMLFEITMIERRITEGKVEKNDVAVILGQIVENIIGVAQYCGLEERDIELVKTIERRKSKPDDLSKALLSLKKIFSTKFYCSNFTIEKDEADFVRQEHRRLIEKIYGDEFLKHAAMVLKTTDEDLGLVIMAFVKNKSSVIKFFTERGISCPESLREESHDAALKHMETVSNDLLYLNCRRLVEEFLTNAKEKKLANISDLAARIRGMMAKNETATPSCQDTTQTEPDTASAAEQVEAATRSDSATEQSDLDIENPSAKQVRVAVVAKSSGATASTSVAQGARADAQKEELRLTVGGTACKGLNVATNRGDLRAEGLQVLEM